MQDKDQKVTETFTGAVENERIYYKLDNGYNIIELLTLESAEKEYRKLKSYAPSDKNTRYFSLRDEKGQTHALLDIDTTNERPALVNCIGMQNPLSQDEPCLYYPKRKHCKILGPFLLSQDWDLLRNGLGVHIDLFVIVADFTTGKVYNFDNISSDFKDQIYLPGCDELIKLPKELRPKHLLVPNCKNLESLPDSLIIKGEVDLSGCTKIKTLPDLIHVGKDFNLKGCTGLKQLPEDMSVDGYLFLTDCTKLTKLPEMLFCDKVCLSGCTGLRDFPEKFNPGYVMMPDDKIFEGRNAGNQARQWFAEKFPKQQPQELAPAL